MMGTGEQGAWQGTVHCPMVERLAKPREKGLTMVIDKGLGYGETRDLLEIAADYVDFLKIAFGTSLIYSSDNLRKKIELIKAHGVHVYPGGTLLELAVHQGQPEAFLERARDLGFTCIEVSEGTIDLPAATRHALIDQSLQLGFLVLTELGKKDKAVKLVPEVVHARLAEDLACGVHYVIIEGRDFGRGVGVYDDDGRMDPRLVDAILAGTDRPERIIWEAPQVPQQQAWLLKLGTNANLGNVQPEDVVTLESTRRGLRGDTLRLYLARSRRDEEKAEETTREDSQRLAAGISGLLS